MRNASEYASDDQILAEYESNVAAASEPSAQAAPEAQQQQTAPQAAAPQAQEQPREWQLPWNGQIVRANEDQLLKWASQGYDYSQKMAEFNNSRQDLETRFGRYKEVDEYVQKDPAWWSHVEKSYAERETAHLPPDVKKAIEPLVNELKELKSFQNQWHQEKLEAAAKEDDAKLVGEISTLQKKFNVDFAERDQAGQTLEYRVFQHALNSGIPTFKAAFLDMYGDNLTKLGEARGREAAMRELQSRRSTGLLGDAPSRAPLSNGQPSRPARNYEEAHRQALAEIGLG